MAKGERSRGICKFCDKEMTKGGLSRHIKTCPERLREIAEAEAGIGKAEDIYHLQVFDTWSAEYWLHLEIRASAKLQDLDYYLRSIWLECCGHMSHFSIDGAWSGYELSMGAKVGAVFHPGDELTHVYDYGTTSETTVKIIDVRKGKPLSQYPIFLMARNTLPEVQCQECDAPAKWLCLECVYEHDESGWLCDKHAENHPHDDYGLHALLNSPRVGMCGEIESDEPPY
ncbi:MAG: hypothetical protein U9Q82_09055 [Chloroflexota bacterium]|nr:hypothetical protein [Chloroflexota bacterium]